jgi:outer membrane lipoprotein SlyB
VFETLASSIGAGMVVGGFAGGARGLAKRSRSDSEKGAVAGGYVGGAVGLTLLLIDTLGKAFV